MSDSENTANRESGLTEAQKRKRHAAANAFLQRNRGKPQYRHAPSAGQITGKIVRPLARKFGPGTAQIKAHWPEIVGPAYAELSRPLALKPGKSGTVLLIEAAGPAAALLSANTAQLLGKINAYMGAGAVSSIQIRQGKIRPKSNSVTPLQTRLAAEAKTALKDHKDLQSALDALAEKIKTKNTQG